MEVFAQDVLNDGGIGATQLKATKDGLDSYNSDCDGHLISIIENASKRPEEARVEDPAILNQPLHC